ncbi:hypothetical protein H696_04112 [Fonticula alba]|uniref:RNA helicase n=1 Tax=Fonticula alba TaxID=691883 RepID=A0A058Z5Y5_FONAL|nr:hypothetical protein H696_04112 [Fonticula alba]KCV69704.1 hypothetical protein H696_04112 [Fonticula alba]|eukprot:XP_009496269.1 hypothetical protein H696_04112 [Fonticula alba]
MNDPSAFSDWSERSLFSALGSGARFDRSAKKAFAGARDASAANQLSTSSKQTREKIASQLDFFGTGTSLLQGTTAKDKDAAAAEDDGPDTDTDADEPEDTGSGAESDAEDDGEDAPAQLSRKDRKRAQVRVSDPEAPKPVTSFQEFATRYGIASYLANNLEKYHYSNPTPIQQHALPIISEGREVLAIAPTGSGKTLAYLLPILHLLKGPSGEGHRALFIVPTRELAQQIYREFKRLSEGRNFRVCVLTKASAAGSKEQQVLSKRFDILITTPMRLVHLIQQKAVDLTKLEHLVLDEGDRLLELGFLEQVDEILAACGTAAGAGPAADTGRRPLSKYLFSATLSVQIESMARSFMRDPVRIVVGVRNTVSLTVEQSLMYVGSEEGKLLAIRQIIQKGVRPPVLIFVQSRERAKQLFHELVYDGINVDVIHSERTQQQRDQIVDKFRTGQIWFLIATELMGRGMDFKGVNLVINYDFPQTTVSYIHRVGRAGRAGRPGQAITLFTNDDKPMLRSIATVMKESGSKVEDWMLTLPRVSHGHKSKVAARPISRSDITSSHETKFERRIKSRKRQIIEQSKQKKDRAAKRAKKDAKSGGSSAETDASADS